MSPHNEHLTLGGFPKLPGYLLSQLDALTNNAFLVSELMRSTRDLVDLSNKIAGERRAQIWKIQTPICNITSLPIGVVRLERADGLNLYPVHVCWNVTVHDGITSSGALIITEPKTVEQIRFSLVHEIYHLVTMKIHARPGPFWIGEFVVRDAAATVVPPPAQIDPVAYRNSLEEFDAEGCAIGEFIERMKPTFSNDEKTEILDRITAIENEKPWINPGCFTPIATTSVFISDWLKDWSNRKAFARRMRGALS